MRTQFSPFRRPGLGALLPALLALLAGCAGVPTVVEPAPQTAQPAPDAPVSAVITEQTATAPALGRREHAVEAALAAMSLRQRVGQLFMPAFPIDQNGRRLLSVDDNVRDALAQIQPGGVLLTGLNVDSTEQLTRFIADLQQSTSWPLLIAVDHEGGDVSRITAGGKIPATRIPSPHIVGAVGDRELAFRLGEVIGSELRSLGIQINFAPVADLRTNPENTVIGDRSLGRDPHIVGGLVAQLVRGMQSQGVAAVLKHFPGHGDTREDSHYEAATVPHDLERLNAVEIVPFRYGIDAGAIGVMTGHINLPAVTGFHTPATLSPLLLQSILRDELGFTSLVFSDALNMHALTRYYHRDELVVEALLAGVDVLVHPERPRDAFEAVVRAVEDGRIDPARIDRSARTVLGVKYDLGLLDEASPQSWRHAEGPEAAAGRISLLGSEQHRAVTEEILRRYRQLAREPHQ